MAIMDRLGVVSNNGNVEQSAPVLLTFVPFAHLDACAFMQGNTLAILLVACIFFSIPCTRATVLDGVHLPTAADRIVTPSLSVSDSIVELLNALVTTLLISNATYANYAAAFVNMYIRVIICSWGHFVFIHFRVGTFTICDV